MKEFKDKEKWQVFFALPENMTGIVVLLTMIVYCIFVIPFVHNFVLCILLYVVVYVGIAKLYRYLYYKLFRTRL